LNLLILQIPTSYTAVKPPPSTIFEAIISGTFEGDVKLTRKHLLEYCKLDTLAMVRILEKLQNNEVRGGLTAV